MASQETILTVSLDGVDMDTHRRTIVTKEWVFGKKMVKLVVRM